MGVMRDGEIVSPFAAGVKGKNKTFLIPFAILEPFTHERRASPKANESIQACTAMLPERLNCQTGDGTPK